MSVGSPHKRPNGKHPAELQKLLSQPDARHLLSLPIHIDRDHDVADLAGYAVGDGKSYTIYLDRDFVAALRSGKVSVSGMTPAQIENAIVIHEVTEKVLLDADNDVDLYEDAHEFATCQEHEYVRSLGVAPRTYEAGLKEIIKYCEKKQIKNPPLDLQCSPYRDDPDADDKRALAEMGRLGVVDATKLSKKTVDYSDAGSKPDRCGACEHYQNLDGVRGICQIVGGTELAHFWCKKFEQGGQNGQTQQIPSGLQGGGSENRQAGGYPQSGGSPGGGNPQGLAGGQESQPTSQ